MKEQNFGKRFLPVNLQKPLAVAFYCFTLLEIHSVNFSFGVVFLRRGRVTDIEENNFHVAMGWSR